MASEPILLYSTSTWLAYVIAEHYYGGEHYVWCTPHFDPSSVPSLNYTVPPSASPIEIYRGLRKDVEFGDRHSAKITANRAGILRGVEAKRAVGRIDSETAAEITSIVNGAEIRDFRPVFFVIPYHLASSRFAAVPVLDKAHPLSIEYIIESLPRACFDAIGLEGI